MGAHIVIHEALRHPRGPNRVAIRGICKGLTLDMWPEKPIRFHHIRGGCEAGTWKMVAIEWHNKMPREIVVVVEPEDGLLVIENGDVLTEI